MLQVRELDVDVAGRRVLSGASFTLQPGDKVGLVGRNGAGKSSLLKVLSGEADPAAGIVSTRGSLGHVPQNPRPRTHGHDVTALSHILSGRGLDVAGSTLDQARRAIESEPNDRNILAFAEAEEVYRAAGGYTAESEARRISAGLGLNPERVDLPVHVLSGGERRRVELARVLFAEAEVLLLDEPTNHLDKDAKEWLMGFLRAYRGSLLVVSHDLNLLDSAITRILHLDAGGLIQYRGTYSQYQTARRLDEARMARTAVRQEAEIKRLTTLADVMRRQTEKRAKTAHSIDKRVARLRTQVVKTPNKERRYRVRFPPPPHSGKLAMEAVDLAKSYGGPPIFSAINFRVERGERLLVMGFNGAGKTSLLRILAGESDPDRGSFRLGSGVAPGYYAQEHEGIERGRTVLSHMRNLSDAPEAQLRSLLGMFGLTGDVATQDAGTLSGGEKTKLALAQLVAGGHNLLLLDEPTNNLDPPSRIGVAEALAAWPGTMIVVSHDAEFVETLRPGRVLVMPEGLVDHWDDEMLEMVSLA